MEEIVLENAKKTDAHYAPAVLDTQGKTIYVSGQLPIDPFTREMCKGSVREQTLAALHNVERILKQAGSGRSKVLCTTAYIDDMANWDAVNAAYAEFFGAHRPARTIVCVSRIHFGLQVEINAIASV